MGLTIKEVSEKFGIPSETLRYYERVGVIPRVTRTASGIRDYQEEDIAWVENAKCFRAAGLPIEALIEYLKLYGEGNSTLQARLDLLKEQKDILLIQQKQLEKTLDKLNYKISRYESAVKTGRLTWD
ncbi:MAG: MerR family transcriptional regulator [Thomasclavelia sp.]|uniref:MerR family transcriptional regulator n=1 Tax=Thomasclavelia sp. TaxID=3025757 RepID=UPI0039A3970B